MGGELRPIGLLVTRETSRGNHPPCPFDKLSLAEAWGKYIGRSALCIGCEGNRHWQSRGCTESKRTAILSGLTIQLVKKSSKEFVTGLKLFCLFSSSHGVHGCFMLLLVSELSHQPLFLNSSITFVINFLHQIPFVIAVIVVNKI